MTENMKKGVDYVGVCVVYFCHDGKGNFIMAKRNNNTRDEHGCWDIGGGGLEFGDTIEDTIRKEIQEEYSTNVLDFEVRIDPTKIKNGEPHKFEEVKLFTLNTIPDNVHSQFPNFLSLYRKRIEAH